ncbi:MAG: Xaa-Pro aminopeptidase [Planctomycetes bacterium ADurb.Bin126]|nr:MAG: Xaa-Pro aminopeptidase [Planctomycetes bacterium ADurb.Bin126]HOD81392.1 aminopeptidase P N-terminal domain-containing protein [Phycisphaerae bacterium]HQL76279.1 aminopeptidase P N-terminal domain-containing protein [Phycisphaerae bacterium]
MTRHELPKAGLNAHLPADEFIQRRRRVLERIGPSGVVVLQGAAAPEGYELFRQTNEFYYLCGLDVPHAYLVLDARSGRSTLLLRPRNAREERNEGPLLWAEDADLARAACGVEAVAPVADLPAVLGDPRELYVLQGPVEGRGACRASILGARKIVADDPFDARPSRQDNFVNHLRSRWPEAQFRDLTPILDQLRRVKSPAEVALMRRAGRLAAEAVTRAMAICRPGLLEDQLGALADWVYRANAAREVGYKAIIGCGHNAWFTHYFRNDQPLVDGELVLMDYAPEVAHYTSDIGRMFPVNGRYSPVQRELYGFMVDYHKTLLGLLRPGRLAADVLAEAARRMRGEIERREWSKPVYRQAALKTLEYSGHLSHPVGLSVHDPEGYRGLPLEVGTVFAVDPQLWVPEEEVYIRVEDTVAVTDDGIEVLTAACPLELDEVERIAGTADAGFPLVP